MSAVASAFATAAPPPWRAARNIDALGSATADEAEPGAAAAVDDSATPLTDPEALLLARCAAQIADEAGPHALVHAIGAGRQAALLRAALAALPTAHRERNGVGRALVYVPRFVSAALSADAMLALLSRCALLHGDDALLVVAIATSGSATPGTRDPARDRRGCSTPWLDRLARLAGWRLCQLWTDGRATHALHVLERSARTSLLRAS